MPNLVNANIERGCGRRQIGALYACVPTSTSGTPIEYFIVDPPLPWNAGHFRGARLHTRADGTVDMLLWVGAEHYPFVSDFIEEARIHGISRRVPVSKELGYSILTPNKSRILLVHPRAIFEGGYTQPEYSRESDLRPSVLPTGGDCNHPTERTKGITYCAFAGWGISSLWSMSNHSVEEADLLAKIITPSVEYFVRRPNRVVPPTLDCFRPGIFAAFPLSHFEFVNPNGGLSEGAANSLGRNTAHTAVTRK